MAGIECINGRWYDFREKGLNVNESFLITAKELKTVGIKNYYFMLRWDNPRAAEIDPFKRNITIQEINILMAEYRYNMWAFMRTASRVRTDKGIVPYTLHRGLAAMAWCFEHHFDNCLCEPRQTYKTTGTIAGPLQWSFQLSTNLHMHFYGKATDNTKRNLGHLKSDIELLPEWIQFRRYLDEDGNIKKSRASSEILTNSRLKNDLTIYPQAHSLSHAESIGRGGTGAVLYYDEMEHTPYFPIILANSSPLFKTASENAADAGSPYCRCFSCTPGNLDSKEGRDSYPIIKSMIPWSEKIYDMTMEEIDEYRSTYIEEYHKNPDNPNREVMNVFYIEYRYYQLRRDYQWVIDQYKLSGDKMAIRREILLNRLRGSTESPIDPEDIEYLISNVKAPFSDIIIDNKWKFNIYEHGQGYIYGRLKDFDETIPYLVGIDPAGGGGGDNFAITIVNPYNLQIAAEFKSQYISGPAAVRMLVALIQDYIPKAILIPERNNMGIYLIQMICETSIRENLYWNDKKTNVEEIAEDSPDDYNLRQAAEQYRKYGHWTGKNRGAMFELLFMHIAQCKQLLNTENLVDDICKLVKTSTGKIAAGDGEHDDCVMSYLIAIYTFYNAGNLINFGIDTTLYKPEFTVVEKDLETREMEADTMAGFFSTTNIRTYDDTVMEAIAKEETKTKELVSRFDWIKDDRYTQESLNSNNTEVSIGIGFFDMINGL